MDNTSYIAKVSYVVENLIYSQLSIGDLQQILIQEHSLPDNLQLIDGFLDKKFGSSGCAFLDTDTGEVIVGFAGTNLDNGFMESLKDLSADGAIALGGINPNSLYNQEGNRMMNRLKEAGYNITHATGHSLGGNTSVAIGINHNIPYVVTYNAAPSYGNPLLLKNIYQNHLKKYDGRIIQFVSEKDWLNNISDGAGAFYIGEKYILYNGKSHDMKFFLRDKEQAYIESVLMMEKGILEGKEGFALDFDKDGQPDLTLTKTQLTPKNLLSSPTGGSGMGTTLDITPESLENLGFNLTKMAENDCHWIQSAVTQCADKNTAIQNDLENRHDTLSREIVNELEASSLGRLLEGINESFGKIERKLHILEDLESFDAYAINRIFDERGGSQGRKWFANGQKWDNAYFISAVNNLKEASRTLRHTITATGEFEYVIDSSYQRAIYTYDTFSKIGEAFVVVTNGLEPKIKKVFKGSGLREGKQDGISEALVEVFEIETQNVKELKKGLTNLSEMAHGVAQNFKDMDDWLKRSIENGQTMVAPQVIAVPSSYQVFLEESAIFDDVKDVLEAFDQQVEERSMKLAKQLATDYDEILSRLNDKCSSIIGHIYQFERAIVDLNEWMGQNITSTYEKQTTVPNPKWKTGDILNLPTMKKSETVTETFGQLSSAFPSHIVESIDDAGRDILPLLPVFEDVLTISETFGQRLYDLRNYLKSLVERGVYKSMELDCIVVAQNGMGQVLERMATDLSHLNGQVQNDSHGKALENFSSQIDDLVTLMGYFGKVAEDCFGVKVDMKQPTAKGRK